MTDDEPIKAIKTKMERMLQENLSDEEIATLLPQFEQLEEDFRDIGRTLDSQTAQWRKQKGKERLPLLLNSQEETLRCLEDSDPNIRELALHLANVHWEIGDRISEICERMAITDPSLAVRMYAIGALGNLYRGQKNSRVGTMCAKLVSDPQLNLEERRAAYFSLVLIMGDDQSFSIPRIVIDFPKSIDWHFVRRHLA
jgi:hypothetical protein